MLKYTNAALYNVNLEGDNSVEFDGEHPTLCFQSKMEKEMYIAIPFTTYTKEKWEKLKKYMCCRSVSTNSIARIDKMEIIPADRIKNRWRENGNLLIPDPEDLDNVINKALAYFKTCFFDGKSAYTKANNNTKLLLEEFEKLFNKDSTEDTFIGLSFGKDECMITFSKNKAKDLSIQEIYDILNHYFVRKKYRIGNDREEISIIVSNTDKNVLTLKEKYDKVNSTEG